MRLAGAVRIVGAVLLAGGAAGSFVVTAYLSRLEAGLQQNVAAASALLEAQTAIRDRNTLLADVTETARGISRGLDGLLVRGEAIQGELDQVASVNRATLDLNRELVEHNSASEQDLARVVTALQSMNQSAAATHQHLIALHAATSADMDALRAIGANTARMNVRTPGW